MQLICEAYNLMKTILGMSDDETAAIFKEWNTGVLDSYLIEITANILSYKENGETLVDKILDTAGQKGTGKWTAQSALDFGTKDPIDPIGEEDDKTCLLSSSRFRRHAGLIAAVLSSMILQERRSP